MHVACPSRISWLVGLLGAVFLEAALARIPKSLWFGGVTGHLVLVGRSIGLLRVGCQVPLYM